ncbi:MAG: hemolysin, partial [Gemmatimonadota bacterium]|nr:hemolysin [Gemmatimonadota bacterium]
DGLVTLEDILEELVGEIVDETDIERQPIIRVSRHEILVEGGADLREINQFFNTAFPQLEHRSLNGYLLDELGYVPEPGEEIEREGILLRIEEATETQVLRVRMTRTAPVEAEPAAIEEDQA